MQADLNRKRPTSWTTVPTHKLNSSLDIKDSKFAKKIGRWLWLVASKLS